MDVHPPNKDDWLRLTGFGVHSRDAVDYVAWFQISVGDAKGGTTTQQQQHHEEKESDEK